MGASDRNSGIMFTDCEFTASVSAGASASAGGGGSAGHAHAHETRRWEVVIAGKRIKTVDVHAHCIVPEAAQIINHPLEAPALLWSDVGDRLAQMDRSGRRCRGAQHQPVLVSRRARRGGRADPGAERAARRVLRQPSRPLCRLRDRRAAIPRSRRRAGRARRQESRLPRRRGRRQRRRPGPRRSEIPPVLGEVRGAWGAGLHAPARHARIGAERKARPATAC